MNRKIVVAISGASGAIYAKRLLENLLLINDQYSEVAVVFSPNAKQIWNDELGEDKELMSRFIQYSEKDFSAPFASGSSSFDTLLICPCSMGMLGRIANGISNCLISRAADVMLKERKKLILITRESPLNLIHIENLRTLTLAGAIICPANPSFYSKPQTIEQIADTVVHRSLALAGFDVKMFRWNEFE